MKQFYDAYHRFLSRYKRHVKKKLVVFFNRRKARAVKRSDVSIISNNCCGGIMYHDLNLPFFSPTINLFFETRRDYLTFLSDLKAYTSKAPKQIFRDGIDYPVGEIEHGQDSVVIHFKHYPSFDAAAAKWIERGKRIRYNNLFIVWEVPEPSGPSEEEFRFFDRLDFDKKLLITGRAFQSSRDYICKLRLYENYHPGKILEYRRSDLSAFRYLDQTRYWRRMN